MLHLVLVNIYFKNTLSYAEAVVRILDYKDDCNAFQGVLLIKNMNQWLRSYFSPSVRDRHVALQSITWEVALADDSGRGHRQPRRSKDEGRGDESCQSTKRMQANTDDKRRGKW